MKLARKELSLVDVKRLPKGVATHRSIVVRDKVIWAWKPLSSAQRIQVHLATRAVYFDQEHFGRVLDARMVNTKAIRRLKNSR